MQIIITDAWLARSRAVHLLGRQLAAAVAFGVLLLMAVAVLCYHLIFSYAVEHDWPWLGAVARNVMLQDGVEQQRIQQANIDAMARKLGEMQARVMQLESLGERVMGLAGLPAPKDVKAPGQGGILVPGKPLQLSQLNAALDDLGALAEQRSEWLTVAESRLFDAHIRKRMLPTHLPVDVALGSPFGWRIDPFTGQSALHTGQDFPAATGTDIVAAAGGVVVAQQWHPAYGNMLEIDHGNQLMTRYAHASKTLVKLGDLVRRGQKIAEVGSTGRSTGPHLHFEVWLQGVLQNPQQFLHAAQRAAPSVAGKVLAAQ